ncbi:MAG: glutamate-1-semialdehyde 2,1-aminomutase [Candidatus Coatesbacteria bacterium]
MNTNRKLMAEARRHLVGGVNSPVRAFGAVGGTPPFIVSGRGAHLRDAAGRRYLDFIGGWGPHLLGHSPAPVVAAVRRAVGRGTSYGMPTPVEAELAALVKSALPSVEKLRFVNSGTEATMSAIRLARAATRRDLVVKFDGCYHGHSDGLLAGAGSGLATFGIPASAGVPKAFARLTLTIPFNDVAALEDVFRRQGRTIAAVIVEPVVGNMGVIVPRPWYLDSLRRITKSHGALLIMDEVMTGFRVAWGGAQVRDGIRPDLTTLGKVIGGGFPVGAYGGRADLMGLVSPEGPVYQAGTLSGNPVAMVAGLATLRALAKRDYDALARTTASFCARLRAAALRSGAEVWIGETCGMFTIFFTRGPVWNAADARKSDTRRFRRFFHAMLKAGVLLPPSQFEAAFLGFAHTKKDLDYAVTAASSSFREGHT